MLDTGGKLEGEDRLRRAFEQNRELDLSGEQSSKRIVRGSLMRDLILSDDATRGAGGAAPLLLKGIRVAGALDLSYARLQLPIIMESCDFDEAVRIREARLPALTLRRCNIPAIDAQHAQISGELDLSGLTGCRNVTLAGAHVSDDVHLCDAQFLSSPESIVDARCIRVQGDFDCARLRLDGRLSLEGAGIGGSIILDSASLTGDGPSDEDKALQADGASIGYELRGNNLTVIGQLSFEDFRCPASLEFKNANLVRSNPHNRVLVLDRSVIGGSIFCDGDFHAEGVVRAVAITLGGSVYLNGANFDKPCEGALILDRSIIKGQVRGSRGSRPFSAHGTISMKGADIAGNVDFRGSRMHVDEGLALALDGSSVGGNVFLSDGLSVTGGISLVHSRIPQRMILDASKLRSRSPVSAAMDLNRATVGTLHLIGAPQGGVMDLTGASVGLLIDEPKDYTDTKSSIVLNGLTYNEIHANGVKLEDRLAWLRAGTLRIRKGDGTYAPPGDGHVPPQPWLQLAAAYRRLGSGRDARIILLNKERQSNQSLGWRKQWPTRLWNYVQDWTIGYGYVPWRAFLWIFGMLVLGIGYFGAVQHPVRSDAASGGTFTWFDAVTYPVDLLLPVGLGGRAAWHPVGVFGLILALALSIAGWVFSITAIAGITRSLRTLDPFTGSRWSPRQCAGTRVVHDWHRPRW